MPLEITVPTESSWTEQDIELGGIPYTFIYKLNESLNPARMYLDIFKDSIAVKTGIKLIEGSISLDNYILEDFDHGMLVCIKKGLIDEPLTLGTTGIGKTYGLYYYTFEELVQLLEAENV